MTSSCADASKLSASFLNIASSVKTKYFSWEDLLDSPGWSVLTYEAARQSSSSLDCRRLSFLSLCWNIQAARMCQAEVNELEALFLFTFASNAALCQSFLSLSAKMTCCRILKKATDRSFRRCWLLSWLSSSLTGFKAGFIGVDGRGPDSCADPISPDFDVLVSDGFLNSNPGESGSDCSQEICQTNY